MDKQEVLLKLCQFSRSTAGNHINYDSQLAISHGWSWGYCLSLTGPMSIWWIVLGYIHSNLFYQYFDRIQKGQALCYISVYSSSEIRRNQEEKSTSGSSSNVKRLVVKARRMHICSSFCSWNPGSKAEGMPSLLPAIFSLGPLHFMQLSLPWGRCFLELWHSDTLKQPLAYRATQQM